MNTFAVSNVKDSAQEPFSQSNSYSKNNKKKKSLISSPALTKNQLDFTSNKPESKIGHHFSGVQIQDNSVDAKSPKIQSDFNKYYHENGNTSSIRESIGNHTVQKIIKSGMIQPKLKISYLNDPYEREADRISEQIMQVPISDGEDEEVYFYSDYDKKIQRKLFPYKINEKKQNEKLKISKKHRSSIKNLEIPEKIIHEINGVHSGKPLDGNTKQFMESRFNHDFSNVRIHDDSKANELASVFNARAFTKGNHIFFGRNESSSNKHLMAHELTHVVQQNSGTYSFQLIQPNLISPTLLQETSEKEADDKAEEVASDKEVQIKKKESSLILAETAPPTKKSSPSKDESTKEDLSLVEQKEPKQETTDLDIKKSDKDAKKTDEVDDKEKSETSPKEEKSPTSPEEDTAFQEVLKTVKKVAKKQKRHLPAKRKAADAQNAAEGPKNEKKSKAADAQVGKMNAQKPKEFDSSAFVKALEEKILKLTPKTQQAALDFKKNKKAAGLKNEVVLYVNKSKESAQGPIKTTTKERLDINRFKEKPVTKLPPTKAGSLPQNIKEKKAIPKAKTESEISLQKESKSLDQEMENAEITEPQLMESNEPDFQNAVSLKHDAQTRAIQAPISYRQDEMLILEKAQNEAKNDSSKQLKGMYNNRKERFSNVVNIQGSTKSKDEKNRQTVSDFVEREYQNTKESVEKHLNNLDKKVNQIFDEGAEKARKEFEEFVSQQMSAYKRKRYSGLVGKAKWLKDWATDLPKEVNTFYINGRKQYLKQMKSVIKKIAKEVEKDLIEAKVIIAKGFQEIKKYVKELPKNLQKIGKQALEKIQNKFDSLNHKVTDKQSQLVDSLAKKYVDNLKKIDKRIEQMKEENKGFVSKAKDAIVGVGKAIINLKNLLFEVLAKAASVIGKIIRHPIRFLNNLVRGVKLGLNNFVANLGENLQQGFMAWLFGTLSKARIQMPKSFDLKGILSIVSQVLGLTRSNIHRRAVKILGEEKVQMLETGSKIFMTLINEGPAGVWEDIKERIGDIKTQILEGIKSYVKDKIIIAGITWIVGLLNPASAFIKAALAIYDIVTFFVTRRSQIKSLVSAVIDSISAIANGTIDLAAKAVENALKRAIPVAIGFLASLLRLGGISKKINDIIKRIQAPINRAIDWVINKAANLIKRLVSGGKSVARTVKNILFPPQPFDVDGQRHTVYGKELGGKTVFMLESKPQTMTQFLNDKKSKESSLKPKKRTALNKAISIHSEMKRLERVNSPKNNVSGKIIQKQLELTKHLRTLMSKVTTDQINKYVFEGLFGTYRETPKQSWDKLSPDHQPQHALIKRVSEEFPNTRITDIAKSRTAKGFSVNLHENRHKQTLTFGGNTFTESEINTATNRQTIPQQKDALANLMIQKRNNDANHVVNNIISRSEKSPVWSDIAEFSEDEVELKKNVNQIRSQISRGESQIKGTDNQIKEWLKDK